MWSATPCRRASAPTPRSRASTSTPGSWGSRCAISTSDCRRPQVGTAAIVRGGRCEDRRALSAVAAQTRRRRGEKAATRRRQLPDRRRHPSLAAVRGNQELHATRGDPHGGPAGDPEFRPPVDPDHCPRSPDQLRAVRYDGLRPAVCGRRQGGQARRAGHLPARRRLVRAERDGARHRGAAQIAAIVRHQPKWRLDR